MDLHRKHVARKTKLNLNSSLVSGMTRILRNLVKALIIGLGLFGFIAILTFGTPFSFDYPYYPRSLSADGYAYQPLFVGLDLPFWIVVAFFLVAITERVSSKWGDQPFLRHDERTRVKFFAAMLFFGSALFSLWAAVSISIARFSGWELGALVFAISGIIVLVFPTAVSLTEGNDTAL